MYKCDVSFKKYVLYYIEIETFKVITQKMNFL